MGIKKMQFIGSYSIVHYWKRRKIQIVIFSLQSQYIQTRKIWTIYAQS